MCFTVLKPEVALEAAASLHATIDQGATHSAQSLASLNERVKGEMTNVLERLALTNTALQTIVGGAEQNLATVEGSLTERIRDADVRNDLLILQDTLDLKLAGLVPRLDVMRRRAIEASDQESLIQAMADRAIARRQFPGKALLLSVIDLPFSISPVVVGLMLVLLYSPNHGLLGEL